MSYRTFKRAIGETNLERKCRLLFGACLLLLISLSFWSYSTLSDQILFNMIGKELTIAALYEAHWDISDKGDPLSNVFEELNINERIAKMLRRRHYQWDVILPENEEGVKKPTDEQEYELMDKWLALGQAIETDQDVNELEKEKPSFRRLVEKTAKVEDKVSGAMVEQTKPYYQYYEPLFTKQGCIDCHSKPITVARPDLKVGDLLAVMKVEIDAEEIRSEQRWNWVLLITFAIITVFLAMIALYVIVRYVIVKPLRHLRDVSNAIRRGDVEQRAVIHTGDEFEELGASFNRMLRQLLRQQDELRSVNGALDSKLDELAQANMRLFEMNQLKSDFLATISHELRTPLNSIIGFSDLLEGVDSLPEKEQRYAQNIQRSGNQLLEMINDILDLAKIESGKLEVRPSQFEIGLVVATQCDLARPLSEKKNIDLEYETAPGLPSMKQDQGKIEQILNNLLSNAIKFTPDGGRIQVKTLQDSLGDLRLSVSDTGVGISESEQALVFEKFRQGTSVLAGGNAMTREYSGTGLGLSIVRELCRLLGGDITLESELGKGSIFTVHLPWRLEEQTRIESPLAEELKQMTKPRSEIGIATPALDQTD
ncbi:MAG: HAMP domain-containing histidine kinase [Pirellulales bacterium]|nr:HAMP domain-containing histidine kinase [Pirellulales bacterium]